MGIFRGQLGGDAGHLGPGLGQADPGGKASNHIQPASITSAGGIRIGMQRYPDRHNSRRRIFKISWEDADDRDWFLVKSKNPADDPWIGGEIASPEIVAENRDRGALPFRQVFAGHEITPQHGRDS